jgi:hypothetical protein
MFMELFYLPIIDLNYCLLLNEGLRFSSRSRLFSKLLKVSASSLFSLSSDRYEKYLLRSGYGTLVKFNPDVSFFLLLNFFIFISTSSKVF